MAATTTTNPAMKAMYAAIGVGGAALERARTLPQKVAEIPGTVTQRATELRENGLSLSPARVRELLDDSTQRVRKAAADSQKRAGKVYTQFSKRGEKVVRSVQRSAPLKRAVSQTKQARSRVKAAATSVSKAATASGEAAKSAVDTATSEQQAG